MLDDTLKTQNKRVERKSQIECPRISYFILLYMCFYIFTCDSGFWWFSVFPMTCKDVKMKYEISCHCSVSWQWHVMVGLVLKPRRAVLAGKWLPIPFCVWMPMTRNREKGVVMTSIFIHSDVYTNYSYELEDRDGYHVSCHGHPLINTGRQSHLSRILWFGGESEAKFFENTCKDEICVDT